MKYDIVPVKNNYRGMGRLLLATDMYTRHTKKQYEVLLHMYYEYLSIVQQIPSKAGLIKLINFCDELEKYQIKCEVIAYDVYPLEAAFGYTLVFLGIDIVHEMSESLICECANNKVKQLLNENGLCNSEQDVNNVLPLLDHGDVKWNPCYVYKISRTGTDTNFCE